MLSKLFGGRRHKKGIDSVSAREEAGRLFAAGSNCAQAVLRGATGIDTPEMMQIAKAFGGGIGGSKCLCGALSGAVMALGLRGRDDLAGRMVASFRQTHGATCCISLSRDYRWNSPEHRANCQRITEETAATVTRLLAG